MFAGMSVRENLEVAAHTTALERRRRRDEAYVLFPQLAARDNDAAWHQSTTWPRPAERRSRNGWPSA